MPRLPSLRQLLLLLVFACVLPMAGMALGLIAHEYQRQRAQVEADTVGTARALMAAVDALRTGAGVSATAAGPVPGPAAEVDPALLREVLAHQKLPSAWIAAVLDGSGTIVARTHDHERFAGTRARAALVARIAEVPEDAVESVTVDGVPVVTAFSRSQRSGWSVAIGIPRAELQQPIVRSTSLLLLGTALVMLLTALVAWWMARSLSASVEALGSAVRASGHHADLELPRATFQEAWQLGVAFAHAHAALEDADVALARNEARMRAVLEAATEAIVTADAAGRIVLFNRAAERMFRLEAEDALGRQVESLVPPEFREGHRALREGTRAGAAREMAGGRVIAALRSDGTRFLARASISVAESDEGRLFTVMLYELPRGPS